MCQQLLDVVGERRDIEPPLLPKRGMFLRRRGYISLQKLWSLMGVDKLKGLCYLFNSVRIDFINITYFVTIYLQFILITFWVTHDVEHCKSHWEFHFCECVIWSMESIQVIKGSWTSWRIKTHHYGKLWMFCLQHFIKEIILSK